MTPEADGVNVAVFSAHAEAIEICLFDAEGGTELARLRLPGRTGDVFHGQFRPMWRRARATGCAPAGRGSPSRGTGSTRRNCCSTRLRRAIDRPFGLHPALFDPPDAAPPIRPTARPLMPKGDRAGAARAAGAAPPPFDWDRQVIYELHVRGFTMRHPDIPPPLRGTFAGLAHPAAIAHLRALGVTAVELMPCRRLDRRAASAAARPDQLLGLQPGRLLRARPAAGARRLGRSARGGGGAAGGRHRRDAGRGAEPHRRG